MAWTKVPGVPGLSTNGKVNRWVRNVPPDLQAYMGHVQIRRTLSRDLTTAMREGSALNGQYDLTFSRLRNTAVQEAVGRLDPETVKQVFTLAGLKGKWLDEPELALPTETSRRDLMAMTPDRQQATMQIEDAFLTGMQSGLRARADTLLVRDTLTAPALASPQTSISALVPVWLAAPARRGSKARRDSTKAQYGTHLKKFCEHAGDVQVDQVTKDTVRAFVAALAAQGLVPTVVNDTLGSVSRFLRWCARTDYIESNPADVVDGVALPELELHHAAMPYQEVPNFYAKLVTLNTPITKALRLVILTAARVEMVLQMTTDELDLSAGLWSLPGTRMKSKRPFVCPLTAEAVQIARGANGEAVFPGLQKGATYMDNSALIRFMKNKTPGYKTHGFRTSFTSWADAGKIDLEAVDSQLDHQRGTKVDRAYRRDNLLERRRAVLEQWTAFVTGLAIVNT